MKAFHFRLQRVLEFREAQFQMSQADFQRANAKLADLLAEQGNLESYKAKTKLEVSRIPSAQGRELTPLTGWYQWTDTERVRLAALVRAATEEVERRRLALLEAQRRVKLLEKLRTNRKGEWQKAFDLEIEDLAADSASSRYAREAAKH